MSRSGRTRPGNTNIKRLLGTAAMAAVRNKDSFLAVYFRRLSARRGGRRARSPVRFNPIESPDLAC